MVRVEANHGEMDVVLRDMSNYSIHARQFRPIAAYSVGIESEGIVVVFIGQTEDRPDSVLRS